MEEIAGRKEERREVIETNKWSHTIYEIQDREMKYSVINDFFYSPAS